MSEDAKVCPKCGKSMIRWATGEVLLSYPAQYPWEWRCGCGNRERGGIERGKTEGEIFREAWEAVNTPPTPQRQGGKPVMSEQVNLAQLGKVILTLQTLESIMRLDGAHITGVDFDPIEQTVTLAVVSRDFPLRNPLDPVEACFLEERAGRIVVLHPRAIPLNEVKNDA